LNYTGVDIFYLPTACPVNCEAIFGELRRHIITKNTIFKRKIQLILEIY